MQEGRTAAAVGRPSPSATNASTRPATGTPTRDASVRQRPGKLPNKRRPSHELHGRNQHTPGTGKPRLEWQTKLLTIRVPDGSTVDTAVRLRVTGKPTSVTAVVNGGIKGVVTVRLDRLTPLGDNRYELPISAALPATTKSGYLGTISLRQGKRELGRPLPVVVVVTKPAPGRVPTSATPPSRARVATVDGAKFVSDELVLLVADDAAAPDSVALAAARAGGGIVHGAVQATRTYQIRFPGLAPRDLDAKAVILRGVAGVEAVTRNYVATEGLVDPDDSEWDSWGDTPAGNNANFEYTGMRQAWDVTTGSSGIRMAVIDLDMDRNHSDLDDNVGRIDGRGAAADGHGTHTAGTICAEGDNDKGVTGMMWDCDLRLFPAGSTVSDTVTTQEQMVKAANDGSRVVNLSLGYNDTNRCGLTSDDGASQNRARDANAVLGRAVLRAQRDNRDVLWVFAAGNECRDARYQSPASLVADFPLNTMTIANAQTNGGLQDTSNFGSLITVAAPGTDLLSTVPRSCFFGLFCRDRYDEKTGTSMAAPQVAGLAGLLFSHNSSLTAAHAKTCIVNGARSSGPRVTGRDFHVINAPAALACKGTIDLPAKVDVVLSMDLTGSMGGVLDRAKAQVTQAIADMKAASPSTDFRFAVTSYEDYPADFAGSACGSSYSATYGAAPDAPFRINQNATADAATVQSAINGLQLGNGGDGPEAYGRALWELAQVDTAATIGFRSDALRLIVNFGDNVPHDQNINDGVDGGLLAGDTGIDPGRNGVIDCGGDDIDFQSGALASLRDRNVKLLQVDSSGDTTLEPYWRHWASQTGGAYTKLDRDDGRSLSEVILELLSLLPPS
ncbi:S8 family serine peptidase [Actinoplanes sp. NPDC051346]|uniref:S8 family serine peptidase n=1 Tax=Actinoplanes sp. NPDC051346 TaxID=3155048 RepID=UPI003426F966